jgi:hypothetical protein
VTTTANLLPSSSLVSSSDSFYLSTGSADVIVPANGTSNLLIQAVVISSWAYGNSTSSQLNSNTVSIRILSVGDNAEIYMILKKNSEKDSVDNKMMNRNVTFSKQCSFGQLELVNRTCPNGFNVTLECVGAEEIVYGTCPSGHSALTCASVTGNALDCNMTKATPANITCHCVLRPTLSLTPAPSVAFPASRRRLSSSSELSNLADESGVSHVGAMTVYVGDEFAGTWASATSLNSPADLKKALIVIVAFCVLWFGGLMVVLGSGLKHKAHTQFRKSQVVLEERKKRCANSSKSTKAIQEFLSDYVEEIFPVAFRDTSRIARVYEELKRHHRYFLLLTCSSDGATDKIRVITGVRLLTIQTMLMFLLAVFYDVQAPADDGSCEANVNELSCLQRKSLLQAHETYCQWSTSSKPPVFVAGNYTCSYREPRFSYLTVAYVSVIISIVTAFVNSPIDYLFDFLTAPTADAVKVNAADNLLKRVGRHAAAGARRVSLAAVSAMNNINKATGMTPSVEARNKLARCANYQTIELPESTRIAQAVATATTASVSVRSREILLHRASAKFEKLTSHRSFKSQQRANYNEDSDEDDYRVYQASVGSRDSENDSSEDDHRSANRGGRSPANSVTASTTFSGRKSILARMLGFADKDIGSRFFELSEEVDLQRRYLPANEVETFDSVWGIDPTGEFIKRDQLTWTGFHHTDAAQILRNEIASVQKVAARVSHDLQLATDQHIGVTLLHLFIVDVLGRQTAAARIFESKASEDFTRIRVISRTKKMLACCLIMLLNLIFIVFTVLRAYQRGNSWQRAFVTASVIQILVEVLFNETIEVCWVHLLVPASVKPQVLHVAERMKEAIQQLCSASAMTDGGRDARYFLDAPSYFFVSVGVAKKFPMLLESMLVRAYQSHLPPGLVSQKWSHRVLQRTGSNNNGDIGVFRFCRTATLTATLLTGLQVAAASPFIIQRIFIRVLQPWLLQGLMLSFVYLGHNSLSLSAVVISLALVGGLCVYYTFFSGRSNKRSVSVELSSTDDEPSYTENSSVTDQLPAYTEHLRPIVTCVDGVPDNSGVEVDRDTSTAYLSHELAPLENLTNDVRSNPCDTCNSSRNSGGTSSQSGYEGIIDGNYESKQGDLDFPHYRVLQRSENSEMINYSTYSVSEDEISLTEGRRFGSPHEFAEVVTHDHISLLEPVVEGDRGSTGQSSVGRYCYGYNDLHRSYRSSTGTDSADSEEDLDYVVPNGVAVHTHGDYSEDLQAYAYYPSSDIISSDSHYDIDIGVHDNISISDSTIENDRPSRADSTDRYIHHCEGFGEYSYQPSVSTVASNSSSDSYCS